MARIDRQRWLVPVAVASVLLLVAAGLLSSPPAAQMRIVRQIRSSGGQVGVYPPNHQGWLGTITAALPDAFGEVFVVNLADVPVRKHWLHAMRDWKRLNQVWLNRSGVHDEDLRLLANHVELYALYLNGNPITDQGLRNLGPVPTLRHLELDWTRVSDLAMIKSQFLNLGVLELRGSAVKDASLSNVSLCRHLSDLDLSRTSITDQGLRNLYIAEPSLHVDLRDSQTTVDGASRLFLRNPSWVIQARDGTIFARFVR